jgi:hypothetical protein
MCSLHDQDYRIGSELKSTGIDLFFSLSRVGLDSESAEVGLEPLLQGQPKVWVHRDSPGSAEDLGYELW